MSVGPQRFPSFLRPLQGFQGNHQCEECYLNLILLIGEFALSPTLLSEFQGTTALVPEA